MSPAPIRFGTDGWRGVMADDFTAENVRRVAQATANYWLSQRLSPRAIVGYDNRFQSDMFARLVAEVFSGNGISVYLSSCPVPTPAVSFAIRDRKLCGGVMITASHNPPVFNGYKVKAWYAGSADAEICAAIEQRLDKSPVRASPDRILQYDPRPAYRRALEGLVDTTRIRKARLRVVTDSMHG
ncbi:MAG: phosphoglucomutase/phosphomannomutase family protein, partial [Verrucomicrobiae bacterium]|nr:phosphoglucomutase/phosphomannomutase family protein [Verrucomicrobiae bacterium]